LMRVAIEADVQIYTLLIDNSWGGGPSGGALFRPTLARKPWDHPEETQGRDLLESLAKRTGGLHFRVRNQEEAKQGSSHAAIAIRNQYVLGYQAQDTGTAGKWHRIRIKSDAAKLNIYARTGYYSR